MDNENLDTQKIPDVNCETAEQDHTAASSDEAETSVQKDNWLDEILGTTATMRELGPDELAVHAAGLAHPEDMELEKILAEDWDNVPAEPVEASESGEELPQLSFGVIAEEPAPVSTETTIIPVLGNDDAALKTEASSLDETQSFVPITETPAEESPVQEVAETPKQKRVRRTAHSDNTGKSRPAPKKGYGLLGIPHIVSTLIWLVIIAVVGFTLGRTLWVSTVDLMAFGKPDREVTITITEEDTIDSISKKLHDAGLIEHPNLFKKFAQITGKDADIDVGTFTLNSKYDYNAMINNMINWGPAREEIDIMIPEGYNCRQIFNLLEEKGVCTVAQLEEYVENLETHIENGDFGSYWFLDGMTYGDKYSLEGYLFPDTYTFYTNDEPGNVLRKFLEGFDYRFTDVMKEKLETMESRTGLNLNIRQVVITASMIEKETANNNESYTISSVIFNRLRNSANYPYLNIDATLIYALNGNIDPETGLSKPLTSADLKMDHPYNTYNNRGLPPGPISNPGRNSLDAALDPENTGYYYYVYNPETGKHIFAKTLSEHERNVSYVDSLN